MVCGLRGWGGVCFWLCVAGGLGLVAGASQQA